MLEVIPENVRQREDEEITYYQWVPLILLLLALAFRIPYFFWRILHNRSGMDLRKLCQISEGTCFASPKEQKEIVSNLVFSIRNWISHRHQYESTIFVRVKTWLSRYCCFYGNKREGTYLTALYLNMKLLYLVIVVSLIYLLNAFISNNEGVFAIEWLNSFGSSSEENFVVSDRFPRVTLCDYQIRQLNNIQRYTVQCVLPINLFNEKVFLFLWFWFCFVAFLDVYSLCHWLYRVLRKRNRYNFVKKYLTIGRMFKYSEKESYKKFANKYLRSVAFFAALPSLKQIGSSSCDDWVDRLSHVYTALILLVFGILVSTVHLVGAPIKCWVPAEFDDDDEHTNAFEHYIHNYCWIKNTYYIPMMDPIPTDIGKRQQEEITYYQWVPLILLLQAFMFIFPFIVWKMTHVSSGLHLGNLCETAEMTQCSSPEKRNGVIDELAFVLDKWIRNRQQYRNSALVRFKARVSHVICLFSNKREGTFLTALYLFMKLLYFVNVVGQIVLLNAFITTDSGSMYGLDWLHTFRDGSGSLRDSQRFPRVTLCDFQIRQMNNVLRYTVQCVLPINLFNEKIFLFLWFWFCLVAVLSGYNLIRWIALIVVKKNHYNYVKKYLKIGGNTLDTTDKQLCKKFAEQYLRDDGIFVVRMIGMNSTDIVVMDLLNELFSEYKAKQKPSDVNGNSHVIPES